MCQMWSAVTIATKHDCMSLFQLQHSYVLVKFVPMLGGATGVVISWLVPLDIATKQKTALMSVFQLQISKYIINNHFHLTCCCICGALTAVANK